MSVCPVYNRQTPYAAIQPGSPYNSKASITVDIYLKKKQKFFFQKLPAEIPLFSKRKNFPQKDPYFLKDKKSNNKRSTVIGAVDKKYAKKNTNGDTHLFVRAILVG